MRRRGIRQIDLAQGIGRSQTLVSRLFTGKVEVTPGLAQDVHRYLGTTDDDVRAIDPAAPVPAPAAPTQATRSYSFSVPSGTATLTLPRTLARDEIDLLERWLHTFVRAERLALTSC